MSVTSDTDPVNAIVDILNAEDTDNWSIRKPPVIEALEESTPKGRENEDNDAIYVRGPGLDIERHSAEGDLFREDGNVDILIYSLDKNRRTTLKRDVIGFIKAYANDNFTQTAHHNIEPVGTTDNRQAKITRQTDHFVSLVEVSLERLD
jgi:hypothetical protein